MNDILILKYSKEHLSKLNSDRIKRYIKAEHKRFGIWYNRYFCDCCNELRFDSVEEKKNFHIILQEWRNYFKFIKQFKEKKNGNKNT